ncbi:hypothetical protein ACQGAO_05990 [Rhodococcus sp. 1.20]
MTEQWPPSRQEPPRREPPYENQPFENQPYRELGPMPTGQIPGYGPGYNGYPGPAPKPEPPTDVVTAIQLWWAVTALGLVQGGAMIWMLLGQKSMFVDEMLRNQAAVDAGLTRSDVEGMFPLVIVFSAVLVVIVTAVFLLFVRAMSRGRNWARMLLTFCGVFMLVSAIPVIFGLGGDGGAATLLFGGAEILQAVAAVGAIVMMHRKESNPYFLRSPGGEPVGSSGYCETGH